MAVLICYIKHVLLVNPVMIGTLICRFENILVVNMAKQAMEVSYWIAYPVDVLVAMMG